jgi:hypothetical protein
MCTFARKRLGNRKSDACCGSRYQRDLSSKLEIQIILLWWVGYCLMGGVPELTAVEVLDGFGDFFLRVHHERPAARDGFMDRLTAEHQHDGVIGGCDRKAGAA